MYITREDGTRFVIPSYRDVLSAKKKALLKKEILLLSQSYGEYITLRRKDITRYEVAFSPDAGYLLGESIWHYFKRPFDMIYCEAIPNTTEAILVIVKAGSVYLDGRFPIDSIPEELVIFKTQQNNFEIYIYGDVPISERPEEGKFYFDKTSLKSFKVLEAPVFPTLPLVKTFQLQLVDPVLKSQGIGVLPIRQVIIMLLICGLIWLIWEYLTTHKKAVPQFVVGVVNPYQLYTNMLTTPAPQIEIRQIIKQINTLFTMPGWMPESLTYSQGKLTIVVRSNGASTQTLFSWAKQRGFVADIEKDGIYLNTMLNVESRPAPGTINALRDVMGTLIDRLSHVLPGNHMDLGTYTHHGTFTDVPITINFSNISPAVLDLIAQQFNGLPLVLTKVSLKTTNGNLTGSLIIDALGN